MKENSDYSENVECPCEGHREWLLFQGESYYSGLEPKSICEGLQNLIFSLLLLFRVCITTYSH